MKYALIALGWAQIAAVVCMLVHGYRACRAQEPTYTWTWNPETRRWEVTW